MSRLKWSIFFIMVASFTLLFVGLGSWQWIRYQSKKEILSHVDKADVNSVLAISEVLNCRESCVYRRAMLDGYFVEQQVYFIDNRILNHQVGFDVYALFKPQDQETFVLVKLGWIKGRRSQSDPLPKVMIPPQRFSIKGFLAKPDKLRFYLGQNELNKNSWPKLLQFADLDLVQRDAPGMVLPYVLVADAEQVPGFTYHWVSMSVPPERHLGYSLQWFLLAIAVTMCTWFFVRKKTS